MRHAGAFGNGKEMRVSNVSKLEDADVCTGGVDWAIEAGYSEPLQALMTGARRSRGFGDFWGHMLVAQGSMDAMVEFAPLALWDVAASKLIVEEAGGRVTTCSGEPLPLTKTHILATNGRLHAPMLEIVRRHLPK